MITGPASKTYEIRDILEVSPRIFPCTRTHSNCL
jgi:hypothetical protein